MMNMRLLVLSFLLLTAAVSVASLPPQLHTQGNRILDDRGRPVLLRGVNAASLEWTSDGQGHILETVDRAIKEWHANIVRVPVSQDRWFGLGPEQKDGGSGYRTLVKEVVDRIAEQGCYAIFDLHWSDSGVWGTQIGQHVMPDANSVTFWRSAARVFRNNPGVIFDLYNEPHNTTWEIWRNGGEVKDNGPTVRQPRTYHAVGMQTLLDTVRSQGADNLVIAGGLDWAYDMSGLLKGFALEDRYGHGVVYANHDYPIKGDTIAQWLAKMEAATRKLPVIVSEFGSETRALPANARRPARTADADWLPKTLRILHDHRWSWVAWDLHPAAGPRLISDWNYTPTPSFGVPVKKELSSR
jgi:aryl-phospho-beta-D-glucosidase BglC (GH1 family)